MRIRYKSDPTKNVIRVAQTEKYDFYFMNFSSYAFPAVMVHWGQLFCTALKPEQPLLCTSLAQTYSTPKAIELKSVTVVYTRLSGASESESDKVFKLVGPRQYFDLSTAGVFVQETPQISGPSS